MRPHRPVRSFPAGSGPPDWVLTRLQVLLRVDTLAAGTAPAGRRPLAPRYGSGLLPLRLDSRCSWATRFVAPSNSRSFTGFANARPLPTTAIPLRAPPVCRKGLLAGVARRISPSRSGLRSSSHYPLGNCVGWRLETCRLPDSTRARFLIAARRTVPGSCRRPVMTPAGGTGDICQPPSVLSATMGKAAPVAALLSPVARDYPSRVLAGPRGPPHCGCAIKERHHSSRIRRRRVPSLGKNCARFARTGRAHGPVRPSAALAKICREFHQMRRELPARLGHHGPHAQSCLRLSNDRHCHENHPCRH